MNTIDDVISGVPADDAEPLRAALADIAMLAELPAPAASTAVLGLIHGGVRRHIIRRRVVVAAAAGALALGGTSAAAAQNALPAPAQEAIASFADDYLPVTVPHPAQPDPAQTHPATPVRPTDPPIDAPGRLRNDPQGPKESHGSEAPGQIQKRTKPVPGAPGPATPADPGAHGRVHGSDATDSSEMTTDKRLNKALKPGASVLDEPPGAGQARVGASPH
ncbi:MAG TPA: hypothetical protein VK948_00220 [Aeromicrobium sp.]|nr:hypothetical protein [Aeromicrobium sp.]